MTTENGHFATEKLLDIKVNFTNNHKFKNSTYLPNSIRALLIGASNSGKSTQEIQVTSS